MLRTKSHLHSKTFTYFPSRHEDGHGEEPLPEGNEYRKGSEAPDRPDCNQKGHNCHHANHSPDRNQLRVILLDGGDAVEDGQDEAGVQDEHNDGCVASHADFEEYLVDVGVEEQVVKEIAVVQSGPSNAYPEEILHVH